MRWMAYIWYSDGLHVIFMVNLKVFFFFFMSLLVHFTSIYHTCKTKIEIGKICNMKIIYEKIYYREKKQPRFGFQKGISGKSGVVLYSGQHGVYCIYKQ